MADPLDFDSEILYAWGTLEGARRAQKPFVRRFLGAEGPVLDLGCGRGVMLGLLREAGIRAKGVDGSDQAVAVCRKEGLDADHGRILPYLSGLEPRSVGGIFCSHLIEHLASDEGAELIRQCGRVIRPGGTLVVVTPDAADLRTTERFWLDPTHVRPYPEKLLSLLLRRAGFTVTEVTHVEEPTRTTLEGIAKRLLKIWFMGFMFRGDLAVISRIEG